MSMTEPETIVRQRRPFYPRTDSRPSGLPADGTIPGREGLFRSLLTALHDSRRRQALRAIHQYRHLIAAPRSVNAGPLHTANIFEQPKGRTRMTTSDDARGRPNGHSTQTLTSRHLTWTLIAICIIGFGILHIAGGAIMNGAVKPSTAMPPVQLTGD